MCMYIYVCMHRHTHTHTHTQVSTEAKENTESLKLEFEAVVSNLTWVLGIELWFSARAARTKHS